jgi:hypothetical protein
MSPSFLITLVVAILAVAYWRVALMITIALILALLVTGIGAVSGALAGQERRPTVVAPAEPGLAPDGSSSGPGALDDQPDDDPGGQPVPPR